MKKIVSQCFFHLYAPPCAHGTASRNLVCLIFVGGTGAHNRIFVIPDIFSFFSSCRARSRLGRSSNVLWSISYSVVREQVKRKKARCLPKPKQTNPKHKHKPIFVKFGRRGNEGLRGARSVSPCFTLFCEFPCGGAGVWCLCCLVCVCLVWLFSCFQGISCN